MDTELDAARHGFGKMGFGCEHYRRRCRIRAPCCNDVFHCRHCHNESTKDGHELDRQAVESVICLVCDTEQPVAQVCNNCGVCMGEYFCRACKFFDDDVDKEQYHCKDCGICRVGGKDNFFHCQKCGSCYSVTLRDKHRCIENSMKNNCPICYEYLFDSLRETSVLRCGHTMHLQCFHEMLKHDKFSCPMCSISIFDMDKFLRALDAERVSCTWITWERDGSCATTAGTRRACTPACRGRGSAATASPTTPAGSLPRCSRSRTPADCFVFPVGEDHD